jgi:HAAS
MTDNDQLAAAYLRRLKRATSGLPRARQRELVSEISDHIAHARADQAGTGDGGSAALRSVLDQLGDPEDIAAAAGAPGPAQRLGGWEIVAIILLMVGGFLWVIGWIVGVVLLWISPRWRWPEKLLGTLVWPGGLAGIGAGLPLLLLHMANAWSGGPGITDQGLWLALAGIVVGVAVQILVCVVLVRQARRRPDPRRIVSAPVAGG